MLAAKGSEHSHQAALFCWAAENVGTYPQLKKMFAIPNGGVRNKKTGAMLKTEGVKAGVPDIFLPVARHGVHGLFIELKKPGGKSSDSQDAWITALHEEGYGAALCVGWTTARDMLIRYLS